MYCRVKAISATQSIINLGGDFLRPLNKVYLNITVFHKTKIGQFRQIVSLNKLDVCKIMDNVYNFPLYVDVIKYMNESYPGCIKKCPLQV